MGAFKHIIEDTVSSDIAQSSGKMAPITKKLKCTKCKKVPCECNSLKESPVGSVGRTDANSALAHLSPELKKRFRKLLKDVGGKTVMRYLLSNAPIQEGLKGGLKSDIESTLYTIQQNCKSKKMFDAVDEVLDLMDTEC